jgi:hypothetical protein
LFSEVRAESRYWEYFSFNQSVLQDKLNSAHFVHKVPIDVLVFKLIEHVSTLLLELFGQTAEELAGVLTFSLNLKPSLEKVLLYFTLGGQAFGDSPGVNSLFSKFKG